MPDQDRDETQPTTVRTATGAGAEVGRQGAETLQGQMSGMLDMSSGASQKAARLASENLELVKRLAETMASGAQEASSEVVDLQSGYVRENLQSLLDLSARLSRLSADKASEVGGHLGQDRG